MAATPLDAHAGLLELLHDAEEGFLGFDCISPLKVMLGKPFQEVGERLTRAIFARYGLNPWSDVDYLLHKHADALAAASEAFRCAGWSQAEIRNELGIKHPILTTDPLSSIYDCMPWEPWPAQLAAERFHDELTKLMHEKTLANARHETNLGEFV